MSASDLPKIEKVTPLPPDEAKWIEFKKITYTDQAGNSRVWEAASRKTRGKSGVDAVSIATILRHPSRPPSTVIILQFRPPAAATCVELPAGLIDADETPSDAAVRELREETGYEGKILSISPTIVSDPGMSMTNMQVAVCEVNLKEGDEEPEQHLDDGEFIQRLVVPIEGLYARLKEFAGEGKLVDARLWHWAMGLEFAKTQSI